MTSDNSRRNRIRKQRNTRMNRKSAGAGPQRFARGGGVYNESSPVSGRLTNEEKNMIRREIRALGYRGKLTDNHFQMGLSLMRQIDMNHTEIENFLRSNGNWQQLSRAIEDDFTYLQPSHRFEWKEFVLGILVALLLLLLVFLF